MRLQIYSCDRSNDGLWLDKFSSQNIVSLYIIMDERFGAYAEAQVIW